MKYDFIAQHQQEYPVTTMCQVLEVSVSGYYAWKQRPASARQLADERLSARIRQVHEATHQIYGSRRIRAELAEQGSSCGRKRGVRLMRKLGLQARRRRHRTVTTDSQHGSGSCEKDSPVEIIAIEKEEQASLMHDLRLGKGERHAHITSETLAQRVIPPLHMGRFSGLFAYGRMLF